MGIQAPAHEKFEIIEKTLEHSDNQLNISRLCDLAGVSRSGFYYWCATKDNREAREYQDLVDFKLIEIAYKYRGYSKGGRQINWFWNIAEF